MIVNVTVSERKSYGGKATDGWHTAWCVGLRVEKLYNKYRQVEEDTAIFAFGLKDSGGILLLRKRFSTNEMSAFVSVVRALGVVGKSFDTDDCLGRPCNLLITDGKIKQITPALNEKVIEVTTSAGNDAIERFVRWCKKNNNEMRNGDVDENGPGF